MGLKKLVSRKVKQARREREDVKEFDSVGSITDDKLRREVGSLVKDLKVVDGNYLKFVKQHSRFGKDGGKSEYNKQMLEKARTERVRSQIKRYQEAMSNGVSGMAVAKVVGHVAINAVFNKQFRNDFLDQFKKPIENTAEKLAKAGGQASITGKMMRNSTHVPFDARSAALTELAQTLKFNEDMRNTKAPAKREWLTKSYTESLNALYDWAKEDGVSADSIRRMRNVIIDKDSQSKNPKFGHLYEGMEHMQRDSQRVEFFEHIDSGVFVWEGDFKDDRTGQKFQMIVNTPEYGEPIKQKDITTIKDLTIDAYSDDEAVVNDTVEISKMEAEDFDFFTEEKIERPERIGLEGFEDTQESEEIILDWSEFQNKAVQQGKSNVINVDFSQSFDDVKQKPEPSLEIGSWADVAREVVRRRVPEDIANDIVEQRFSPIIEKATWERVVEELTNQAEKPQVHLNGKYVYNGNGYTTNEHLQRQAEYQLVNDAFDQHLDRCLAITPEMITTQNDGYNRLDLDTNSMQVNVSFVTRERTRRQERAIGFEDMKDALGKEAAKTPTLTDDQLLAKLELAQAEAGVGVSLAKDMEDYQIGN